MKTLADLMVLVFVVSSVFSVGLGLTVSQIVAPLRNARLVAMSLIANFVIVPAAAVGIAIGLSLSEAHAVGVILLGAAAGAPFLPKLVEVARGDVACSVALMVLLMVGSLVYLPVAMPQLLAGVTVSSVKIAQSLLLTMIVPLTVGLLIKARREPLAERLRPTIQRLSSLSLIIVLVLLPAMHFRSLLDFLGTRAMPALALLIGASASAGYLMGGPSTESRRVLSIGTAARNLPATLLIGGQNFADPQVGMVVIVFALMSLLVLGPLAAVMARHKMPFEPPGADVLQNPVTEKSPSPCCQEPLNAAEESHHRSLDAADD